MQAFETEDSRSGKNSSRPCQYQRLQLLHGRSFMWCAGHLLSFQSTPSRDASPPFDHADLQHTDCTSLFCPSPTYSLCSRISWSRLPFYSHGELHTAFQKTSGSLSSLRVSSHAEEHCKRKTCNHAQFVPFTLKDLGPPTKITHPSSQTVSSQFSLL